MSISKFTRVELDSAFQAANKELAEAKATDRQLVDASDEQIEASADRIAKAAVKYRRASAALGNVAADEV